MNTPKHAVLQLASLVALYVTAFSAVALAFSLITLFIPDATDSSWEINSARDSVRFGIAMLVIVFPAYIILTRKVQVVRRTENVAYTTLARWFVYLSLLIGGAVLLGDAVAVLYGYLNGELTMRFFLKALVLAVVVGSVFFYYLRDARDYWLTHETESKRWAWCASVAIVALLGIAVIQNETPSEARERALDETMVSDLQSMQYSVEAFYRIEGRLPADRGELDAYQSIPNAPEDRPAYEYHASKDTVYELCATFATEEITDTRFAPNPNYNWEHPANRHCFARTVEKNTF